MDIKPDHHAQRSRPTPHPNRNPSSLLHPSKPRNQKRPPSSSGRSATNPFTPNPSRTSVNRLKSKIRDLTRLLRRPDKLPADVQVVQERALAGYRQALEQIEDEKRRKRMISKYHMVRFFERQKATRHLKQIRKRLDALPPADSPEERAGLQEELRIATVDLNYTMYCPLNEKYQSLYPPRTKEGQDGKEKNDENGDGQGPPSKRREAPKQKPELWDMVARCAETGQLQALRDGKLSQPITSTTTITPIRRANGEPTGSKSSTAKVKRKKASEQAKEEKSGGESDGGFFEE